GRAPERAREEPLEEGLRARILVGARRGRAAEELRGRLHGERGHRSRRVAQRLDELRGGRLRGGVVREALDVGLWRERLSGDRQGREQIGERVVELNVR